jgi:probable F420-dependent oxidoreductase
VSTRLGLTVPIAGESLSELPGILVDAEAAGYSDIWTSEIAAADAFTPLVLTAATHPGFRLGTAIASAFIRSPALLAMNAAALADIGSSEVLVGIGASSDIMVSRWHGIPFDHPYRRVQDVLRFVRRALSGERVSFSSDSFDIDGFRLTTVPSRPPRLLVAALRERMLRLAGREADGVILNWLSPADVAQVTRPVLEQNPEAEVVARLFAVVAEDRDQARAFARRQITAYLNVPVYADFHRWLGRTEALTPMWQAWAAGDRAAAVAAVPSSLVDELFLTGTPADIAAGVADYVRAGITTPVLSIMSPTGTGSLSWVSRLGASISDPAEPAGTADGAS